MLNNKSHRTVRITYVGASGERDGGEVHIHVSRLCLNCAHDGMRDAEWQAEGASEKWGRCMNGCGAADVADEKSQWCDEHQTQKEFDANIRRPHVPVFGLIQGGAQ